MNNLRSDQLVNTRYSKGGLVTPSGNKCGWWERRIIPQDQSDIIITLTTQYHQRPDKLAYDLYGKSSFMWVILQYNCILDITTEFVTNRTISAPSRNRLTQNILSTSVRSSDIKI